MRQFAARRALEMAGSATLLASQRVREMRRQGREVVDFGIGEPDFPTPRHVVEAAKQALDRGLTHYAPTRGVQELREALGRHAAQLYGLTYDPDREIVVTPGGKQAIYETLMATIDPGDEVLLLDPSWVSYRACVQLAGGVAVPVELDPADGHAVDPQRLAEKVGPRTKAIMLNTPCNPTGRVLSADELAAVADLAARRDLLVFTDQIYDRIVYDGAQAANIATLPGMRERTVVFSGFSKAYAMTGWRLGFLLGPAAIVREVMKIHEHSVTSAATFAQWAAVTALEGPQEPLQEMVAAFAARRDYVVRRLNTIPGVSCRAPQGAFYAFPSIAGTGLDSRGFAGRLLEQAGVSTTPGVAFGPSGDAHLRLSFAADMQTLANGLDRMEAFVRGL